MESNFLMLIIPVVLTAVIGMFGFFVKTAIAANKESVDKLDEKQEKVKEDLGDFKAQLPHHYVLRDDFVRAMIGFDKKLDRQWEAIQKIARAMKGDKE